jgi:type VI secretion system secreted protein VgrG
VAATHTQTHRPMAVSTPLGPDVFLLTGFSGHEGLSQLFHFHLDVLARSTAEVAFDKLLGQPLTVRVELPGGKQQRSFSGICSRVSQGRVTPSSPPSVWKWCPNSGC